MERETMKKIKVGDKNLDLFKIELHFKDGEKRIVEVKSICEN